MLFDFWYIIVWLEGIGDVLDVGLVFFVVWVWNLVVLVGVGCLCFEFVEVEWERGKLGLSKSLEVWVCMVFFGSKLGDLVGGGDKRVVGSLKLVCVFVLCNFFVVVLYVFVVFLVVLNVLS